MVKGFFPFCFQHSCNFPSLSRSCKCRAVSKVKHRALFNISTEACLWDGVRGLQVAGLLGLRDPSHPRCRCVVPRMGTVQLPLSRNLQLQANVSGFGTWVMECGARKEGTVHAGILLACSCGRLQLSVESHSGEHAKLVGPNRQSSLETSKSNLLIPGTGGAALGHQALSRQNPHRLCPCEPPELA